MEHMNRWDSRLATGRLPSFWWGMLALVSAGFMAFVIMLLVNR